MVIKIIFQCNTFKNQNEHKIHDDQSIIILHKDWKGIAEFSFYYSHQSERTPLGGALEHVTLREVTLNQNGTRR